MTNPTEILVQHTEVRNKTAATRGVPIDNPGGVDLIAPVYPCRSETFVELMNKINHALETLSESNATDIVQLILVNYPSGVVRFVDGRFDAEVGIVIPRKGGMSYWGGWLD